MANATTRRLKRPRSPGKRPAFIPQSVTLTQAQIDFVTQQARARARHGEPPNVSAYFRDLIAADYARLKPKKAA